MINCTICNSYVKKQGLKAHLKTKKHKYNSLPNEKKGKGIIGDYLRKRPRNVNNFMDKYGDLKMKKFKVCRKPINKNIEKIAKYVTLGKTEKVKKKFHYDNFYHLYLIITFENNFCITIEKNEIVIIGYNCDDRGGNCKKINLKKHYTFNEVILKSEKKHKNFYRYTADKYNCQDFLHTFITNADITGLKDFVLQKLDNALSKDVRWLSVAITDLAHMFQILRGKGLNYKIKNIM